MADPATLLLENLDAFTAFARARLGDPELARDAVQESLAKALAAEAPEDSLEVTRWFYRILRRTIIDLYRRRDARQRAMTRYEESLDEPPEPAEAQALCACFEGLLPALPARAREVLRAIDLEGGSPARVAAMKGITANALNVQLHRARRRLRELLLATCKVCATHGCLDCNCAPGGAA